MFDRFDESSRGVVLRAQEQARSLGHGWIGTEHLLLALLDPSSGLPATILTEAGVRRDRVIEAIEHGLGRRIVLSPADAEALHSIGIDLDAVIAAVERSFGPGALRPPPTPPSSGPRRLRRWYPKYVLRRLRRRRQRRRDAGPPVHGRPGAHIPFVPRSKKVLELSLRESLRLRHKHIGSEHLLLGLLNEGEGLAAQILVDSGLRLDDLRDRTLRALREAA
jgi:ATP-dependent Clp protease ATP-binding subunit ClpA